MAEEFKLGNLQLPSELLDEAFLVEREEGRPAELVTETESEEEEDYLAGLTRQMAQSFLQDDDDHAKPGFVAGSSPPSSAGRRWSLYERGLLRQPSRPPCPSPFLAHHQLQAGRQHLMQQQQFSAAWERQSRARRAIGGGNRRGRSHGMPPPQMQHQPLPGCGMRAVFLRSSGGARKESIGTGVFLPRTAGTKTEPQKKSACSTVLIPARVVQALNLNLEEWAAHTRFPSGFVLDEHDTCMGRRKPARNHHHPPPAAMTAPISCLPQEWTY